MRVSPSLQWLPRHLLELTITLLMCAAAMTVLAVLGWVLIDVLVRGASVLSWEFVTAAPENAGREGGIGPMLVSTALILAVSLAAVLPVGIGCAVFLSEFARRSAAAGRWIRRSLDVLAGTPSIVFGLFGNVLFAEILGMGFSILSGGLTLACMVLPLLIRSAEQGLRTVPEAYRRASAALGLSRWGTLRRVLLPAAAPAIAAGLVLSVGRAMAETAALIFTSGYVTDVPGSLLDSGRSLTVHILDLSMNVSGGDDMAYGTALVLLAGLLAINSVIMRLGLRWRGDRPTTLANVT